MAHTGIDMSKLLELLNDDIAHLYAAAIQYNQHAAIIEGSEWMGLIEDLLEHALDDFGQAQALSDKVAFLGGIPTTEVAEIKKSEDTLEIARINMETARNSVVRYRERIPQLQELGQFALIQTYQQMLQHEEEHLNTLETMLKVPKVVGEEAPILQMGTPVGMTPEQMGTLRQLRLARSERQKLYRKVQ